jgi:hypothetical protein
MKEVKILAPSAGIEITEPMGDGVAVITDGLGGWSTVERQDAIAVTDWTGQEPLAQDVPLMLDGGRHRRSVERRLAKIIALGRPQDGGRPPVFQVWGPIHYPGKRWVLPKGGITLSTDEDECRRRNDGELYRQALTLHLLEYVSPEQASVHKRGARTGLARAVPVIGIANNVATGSTYRTTGRESLDEIASRLYGDWRVGKDIGARNGRRDTSRPLPPGTELTLP